MSRSSSPFTNDSRKTIFDLAQEAAAEGGKTLTVAGDARSQADIDELLGRALTWTEGGRKVDIVVVNAGRGLAGGILNSVVRRNISPFTDFYGSSKIAIGASNCHDVPAFSLGKVFSRPSHSVLEYQPLAKAIFGFVGFV